MTKDDLISTTKAAEPRGHYSQAVRANGFIFTSGILGIKPNDKEIIVRSFEEQTQICLESLEQILHAAEAKLSDVVKVTIYIDDIDKWPKVNAIYQSFFKDHKPARAVVPTMPLHHGFEIEIDAIALATD